MKINKIKMNKREKSFRKRGLSTIVTTLILILLVLVAIGIVWVVIKNVLTSGAEDVNIGKFTVDLDIKSVQIDNNNIMIKIKRNVGVGEISGLKFAVSNGINTSIFEETTTIKELEEKTYVLNYDGGLVKSVSIAPILTTNSGKEKTGNIVAEKEFSNKEIIQNLGAVSWWRFEGNANDEISGNIGIVNGGATPATGKYGQAYQFDGVDDYVKTPEINLGTEYTIFIWATGNTSSTSMIGNHSSMFAFQYTDYLGRSFFHYTSSSNQVNFQYIIPDNANWYNYIITRNSTNVIFYIDGNLKNSSPSSGLGGLSFSVRYIGGGEVPSWSGTIDEVIVFNKTLSADEIKELYELDLNL